VPLPEGIRVVLDGRIPTTPGYEFFAFQDIVEKGEGFAPNWKSVHWSTGFPFVLGPKPNYEDIRARGYGQSAEIPATDNPVSARLPYLSSRNTGRAHST